MEITVKVNYKNEKLQKLRQAAGLSQSQLAEAAGVNVRMYQKYEQGDRDISKAQLCFDPRNEQQVKNQGERIEPTVDCH